jgi:hypothetical protein
VFHDSLFTSVFNNRFSRTRAGPESLNPFMQLNGRRILNNNGDFQIIADPVMAGMFAVIGHGALLMTMSVPSDKKKNVC